MKTKSRISGYIIRSTAVAVLLSSAVVTLAWAVRNTAAIAPLSPRAPKQSRTLSFADRVAYQRAIEEVYWRHRIWPGKNAGPKPSLDKIMSAAQIEKKVQDYLRNSQLLEDEWHRPIAAEQLQAEMDRMARHTKQPEMLREIFGTLGNDPFVIAECLGRPVLVERLVTKFRTDGRIRKVRLDARRGSGGNGTTMGLLAINYALPTIVNSSTGCTDDTWTPTSTTNAPDGRQFESVVWTGSEMIVWGGRTPCCLLNTGGRYNPSTDSWAATTTANAPDARVFHTAVWTGSEMIIWGGESGGNRVNSGGRYDPSTDSWTATSTTNAPDARSHHTAIWTGSEMIIWGGTHYVPVGNGAFNTGGRYDPSADSWTVTSTSNAPDPRGYHSAVWTGDEMIVWGGNDNFTIFNTGGRYSPALDSWAATSTDNAPEPRGSNITTVWTGSEMIVWGGTSCCDYLNTGGRYNPGTDIWIGTDTTSAPAARTDHTAVWTGSEMIVWGGTPGAGYLNTGGRYNPSTDSWTATSTTNAPAPRYQHAAVWTGNEMIVWGGGISTGETADGGRYCARPNTEAGSNVTAESPSGDAGATFSAVTTTGETSFTPIDPNSAGTPPSGYTLCATCPAYDITTTAGYTPPVTVCLAVPSSIDSPTFAAMALLHGENGMLVDTTTSHVSDPNGAREVCGSVSSLSPFVLAQPMVSKITQDGTTCGQFSSGSASSVTNVTYTVGGNKKINSTTPDKFMYWVKVTAPAGTNTFVINQSITSGNFSTQFQLDAGDSRVFRSTNCKAAGGLNFKQNTATGPSSTVTVAFNAPSAGTYYMAIKFQTRNVKGKVAPTPATVHYSFSTTGVAGSTSGLDLIKQ